jgi:hypothetical protein
MGARLPVKCRPWRSTMEDLIYYGDCREHGAARLDSVVVTGIARRLSISYISGVQNDKRQT